MLAETGWIEQARSLVPPEAVTAAARSELMSRSSIVFGNLEGSNPVRMYGVYSGFFYLPLSLTMFYGDDDPDSLLDLATTLAIGHGHFAIMDRILDEQKIAVPLVPAAQMMLAIYLARMDRRYGAYLDVTQAHDRHYRSYAEAASLEHQQRGRLRSQADFDVAFLGAKAAPSCMPLEAIMRQAGQSQVYPALQEAFLRFACALQLLDDLTDIRVDFADGLSSLPVNLLLYHSLGRTTWPEKGEIDPTDLHALSVLGGVQEACLCLVIDMLEDVVHRSHHLRVVPLWQAATSRLAGAREELDRCREAKLRVAA